MQFEYDERKSESNLTKHGIDFQEAQVLWEDRERLEVKVEYKGESRLMLIAHYSGTCWSAIYTMRGDKVRIISVRRATKQEVAYYDRKRNGF